jgi:methionyl-tRNA formyltransferase
MSQPLNLLFCGTPEFAVPTLEKLVAAGFRISHVISQPDRPRGRKLEMAPSAVKARALQLGLPVTQPQTIKNNEEFRALLTSMNPDAIIVVAYGRIIPQWMIDLPRLGNINLHASLLPKYRGAAPIQWAIANGESTTGVTTMIINAGLDTGDILLQAEIGISPVDTAESLAPRLANIGAELMVRTLHGLGAGTVLPRAQNEAAATLAPILCKEDGRIDFQRGAQEILNRLRGFQPWPGAFTAYKGKTLNIWAATAETKPIHPAELVVEGERLLVGCSQNTSLEVLELQLEGKKRMPARDFIHGYHPRTGEKLGQ